MQKELKVSKRNQKYVKGTNSIWKKPKYEKELKVSKRNQKYQKKPKVSKVTIRI